MKNFDRKEQHGLQDQFPQKYQQEIVGVLESLDGTKDSFLRAHFSFEESDRKDFDEAMHATICSGLAKYFYLRRYLDPIKTLDVRQSPEESSSEYKHRFEGSLPIGLEHLVDKEMNILFYDSPELKLAMEKPSPDLDWTDYFDESFPLIQEWVKKKEAELQEIKDFIIQLLQPLDKKNSSNYGDSESPFELFSRFEDKDISSLDLSDYRIPCTATTMDMIRKNLRDPLEKIKGLIGDKPFTAFEYNTFNTTDNPTTPTPLLLPIPPKQIKPFYKAIRSLGQATNDTYGLPQEIFAKVLVLNFRKFREELNSHSDEQRYLNNLAKRFGRNIQ